MSPKMPRLTAKQVIKILKNAEFVEVSQSGSHCKFFNPNSRRSVIVPIHGNKVLAIGTLKAIEKQSGINFL